MKNSIAKHWRRQVSAPMQRLAFSNVLLCCFSSWRISLECFSQLHLKNRDWKIADPLMHESAHLGIKKRGRGRVLRDGFRACLDVASDAKRSLRPAENAQRLSFAAPEK